MKSCVIQAAFMAGMGAGGRLWRLRRFRDCLECRFNSTFYETDNSECFPHYLLEVRYMPYEVFILPERRLGVVRLFGAVTGDTIVQAIRELCASEEWTPGYNTLWDWRAMRELMVSPAEATDILEQVRRVERRIGSGRTAIVVRDETDYALAQMLILKADTERRERKVFYSIDEVRGWIETQNERSKKSKGFMSELVGAR